MSAGDIVDLLYQLNLATADSAEARRIWRRTQGVPAVGTNAGPPKQLVADVNKVLRARPSESVGCPQTSEMLPRSEPSSRGAIMPTEAQLEADDLLDEMENVEPLTQEEVCFWYGIKPRIIRDGSRRGLSANWNPSANWRAPFVVAKMRKVSRWFGRLKPDAPSCAKDQGMGRCRPVREPMRSGPVFKTATTPCQQRLP